VRSSPGNGPRSCRWHERSSPALAAGNCVVTKHVGVHRRSLPDLLRAAGCLRARRACRACASILAGGTGGRRRAGSATRSGRRSASPAALPPARQIAHVFCAGAAQARPVARTRRQDRQHRVPRTPGDLRGRGGGARSGTASGVLAGQGACVRADPPSSCTRTSTTRWPGLRPPQRRPRPRPYKVGDTRSTLRSRGGPADQRGRGSKARRGAMLDTGEGGTNAGATDRARAASGSGRWNPRGPRNFVEPTVIVDDRSGESDPRQRDLADRDLRPRCCCVSGSRPRTEAVRTCQTAPPTEAGELKNNPGPRT